MSTALNFNSGDYVYAPLDSTFNPTQPWTLEAWVLVATSGSQNDQRPLFGFRSTTNNSELALVIDDASMFTGIHWHSDTAYQQATPSTALRNQYEHLRFIWDTSNLIVKLNGTQLFTLNFTSFASSGFMSDFNQLFIGNGHSMSTIGLPFTGNVDEVRLWQTASVTADYSQPLTGTETNLKAYYKFDEGSGTVTIDSSSGSNDGTIVGASYTTSDVFSSGDSAPGTFSNSTLLSWELEVLKFDGTLVTYNSAVNPPPITNFKATVDAWGNCVECTFTGKPSGLDVYSREVITLSSYHDDGAGGSNKFFIFRGYITKSAPRDVMDLREYRAVGLKKRFDEQVAGGYFVFNDGRKPSIYSGKDVASMATDIIGDYKGEVFGTQQTMEVPAPLGFELGNRVPRFESVSDFLEALQDSVPELVVPTGTTYTYNGVTYNEGAYVPAVKWGVKADGTIFFKRDTRSQPIDTRADGVSIEWLDIDAEEVVTGVVLLYELTNEDLSVVYERISDTTGDLTIYIQKPLASIYRPLDYASGDKPYKSMKVAPFTLVGGEFANRVLDPWTATDSSFSASPGAAWVNPSNVTDGSLTTYATHNDFWQGKISLVHDPGPFPDLGGYIGLEVTYSAERHPSDEDSAIIVSARFEGDGLTDISYSLPIPGDGLGQTTKLIYLREGVHQRPSLVYYYVGIKGFFLTGESDIVRIHDIKMLVIDLDRGEQIARYYVRKPAANPANLTVHNKWLEPSPYVQLVKPDGYTTTVPAATYEYSMDAKTGIVTNVKLEQDLDADASAQRALIDKKDTKVLNRAKRLNQKK